MNKIQLFDLGGNEVGEIAINDKLIKNEFHQQAVFDVVIAERASRRQGTHSTLKKGEVSGGGRKPRKQKHTGRARQGSTRNPHFVGGGIAFGPKPTRNYNLKVNKKVVQLAFYSAFTYQINNKNVFGLIDGLQPDKPSTKAMSSFVKKVTKNKKTLIILGETNEILCKSSRNIPNVILKKWNQVSTQDLLNAQALIVQPSALNHWTERLQ